MKKTLLLILAALLALCCAAEGGNAYVNEDAGFSLTVPNGFERMSKAYERDVIKKASQGEGRHDPMYALNVWMRTYEEDDYLVLEAQVKQPTYASFDEEIAASATYKQNREEEAEAQWGEDFDRMEVYESGTLCETPAGPALRRTWALYLKDGRCLYSTGVDLYTDQAEYCFLIHGYGGHREELDALLDAIVPTISVFPAELKAIEIPVPELTEGGWQAPLASDPETLYDIYMDQTDGSDQGVFMLIDAMNDEEEEIADGHALVMVNTLVDGNGRPAEKMKLALQDSEFGHVLIGTPLNYEGICVYQFADANYYVLDDALLYTADPDLEFDWYFTAYHFPFGRLETLNGLRQDDNGYAYMLVRSDETMSFEFVMKEGFEIVSLRIYTNDGKHLTLLMTVDYTIGDAQPLPEAVKEAREALKASAGTE